jgi:hypothetical protein
MTRGRVRWVAAQLVERLTDAGCCTRLALDCACQLVTPTAAAQEQVRPTDVRTLQRLVDECRHVLETLPPEADSTSGLADVLGKADEELLALGTAMMLLEHSA